jgi:hypothetical protein
MPSFSSGAKIGDNHQHIMGSGRLLLVLPLFLNYFIEIALGGETSSFVRSEWPSTDIPLDNKAFVVPDGYNAPQQVPLSIWNLEKIAIFNCTFCIKSSIKLGTLDPDTSNSWVRYLHDGATAPIKI